MALALYYNCIKWQRARGRVNRGNGKQCCTSLYPGLWGDLSSSIPCFYLEGSEEVKEA